MDLSWRERFEHLGPVRTIARVSSGSPAVIALRLADEPAALRSIDATFALARRGVSMLAAKRAVEAAMAGEQPVVAAPTVESVASLVADLAAAGFAAVPPAADEAATPGRVPIRA
jgi:putative transcriptional regulator